MAKIRNKKTGEIKEVSDKELSKYGLGGSIDMAKNGKKIKPKLKKAQFGDVEQDPLEIAYNVAGRNSNFKQFTNGVYSKPGIETNSFGVEKDPTFNIGDEGYNEQQAQNNLSLNPVTGQYNPPFNPALTYGLQEKYGNKAAPYLNNYEANQYADYVNKQPKQQNTKNSYTPIFSGQSSGENPFKARALGYLDKFNQNLQKGISESQQNTPQTQGLIGSKYGGYMADGGQFNSNYIGAAGNLLAAGANAPGAIAWDLGTMQNNAQVANWEAMQRRNNLLSGFQNQTPNPNKYGQSWQGGNNAIFKDGGTFDSQTIPQEDENLGMVHRFEGDRHSKPSEGIAIDPAKINYTYNKGRVPKYKAKLLVEGGEFHLPSKEAGGKADGDVILSHTRGIKMKDIDGKNATISEAFEKEATNTTGVAPVKLDKYLTKNSKLRKENPNFFLDSVSAATPDTIKQVATPIIDTMQEIGNKHHFIQEVIKAKQGKENDLQNLLQQNQMPMAKKNGGKLEQAGNGKSEGLDYFGGDQDKVFAYAKSKGYKGKNKIGKLQEWASVYDPTGVANYELMVEPSNKALEFYNKRAKEVGAPLAKDTKGVDMSIFSPEERVEIFKDNKWRFRYPQVQNQQPVIESKNFKQKELRPADKWGKLDVNPINNTGTNVDKNYLQGMNFAIPDAYQKDPIWSKTIASQFVTPDKWDRNPETNQVNAGLNSVQMNLGSRTSSDIANSLQAQTNAYKQKQEIEAQKQRYDAQQYQWAQGVNSQSKYNADLQNLGQFNQQNADINKREAAITGQKNINTQAELERGDKAEKDRNTMAWMDKYYNPIAHSTDPLINLNGRNFSNDDVDQIKKQYDALGRLLKTTTTDNKKTGGKIKLKPKLKKSFK